MNLALWLVQGLLAVLFVYVGWGHALERWEALTKRLPALLSLPPAFVRFLGSCELLGVLALLVPGVVIQALAGAGLPAALVMVLPWLTIAAGLGFTFEMLSATLFHVRRREFAILGATLVPLAMALFVAYGRWTLSPF